MKRTSLALMLMVLLFNAKGLADCTPVPKNYAAPDWNDSQDAGDHTDDTAVSGSGRSKKSDPNDAWADWGSARRADEDVPQISDHVQFEKCPMSAGVYSYLWCEDGDTVDMQYTHTMVRDWEWWTKCESCGGYPPKGAIEWLVKVEGHIQYKVNASGHGNAQFNRACSSTMTAKMVTGRTVQVKHQISDNPNHVKKTKSAIVGGSIASETDTKAEVNAKGKIGIALKKAQKQQITGEIHVEITEEYQAGQAIAKSDEIGFEDYSYLKTICHDPHTYGEERASIVFTGSMTAPGSSDTLRLESDYFIQMTTRSKGRPWKKCGATAPITQDPTAEDWEKIAKNAVAEGGTHRSTNRVDSEGNSNGVGGSISPLEKSFATFSGSAMPLFHVIVTDGGQQTVFVRNRDGQTAMQLDVVWAENPEGTSVIEMTNAEPWFSTELEAGNWTIFGVPHTDTSGVYYLEATFEPESEDPAAVANACMEAIEHHFTVARWPLGIHSGASSESAVLGLSSINNVIALKCLHSAGLSPETVLITWEGEEGEWIEEPELVYDSDAESWTITMQPATTRELVIHVSDGDNEFTIPVTFTVAE